MPTTVENLPVPGLTEAAAAALRDQQRTLAVDKVANALQAVAGTSGDPAADRFERTLLACVKGRVATDVEGFLRFARELCDGMDRETAARAPTPTPAPAPTPNPVSP